MCVCLLLVIKDIKGIPRAEENITREQPENPSRVNRERYDVIPVSESNEGEFSVYISRAWTWDLPWPLILDPIAERLVSAAQRAPSCSDRATTSLPRVTVNETTST